MCFSPQNCDIAKSLISWVLHWYINFHTVLFFFLKAKMSQQCSICIRHLNGWMDVSLRAWSSGSQNFGAKYSSDQNKISMDHLAIKTPNRIRVFVLYWIWEVYSMSVKWRYIGGKEGMLGNKNRTPKLCQKQWDNTKSVVARPGRGGCETQTMTL